MPVYYLSNTNSDLSGGADFNKLLATDTEGTNSITVAVAKGATETSYAYTAANDPSNADWETGTVVVEVNVTNADTYMYLTVRADRLNSAGALQESSTSPAEQQLNTTGVKTFTISSMNWTAGATGDRLRIAYIFRSTTKAASCVIQAGDANTEHTTSITRYQLPTITSATAASTLTLSLSVARPISLTSATSVSTTSTLLKREQSLTLETTGISTSSLDLSRVITISIQIDALTTVEVVLSITKTINIEVSSISRIINELISIQSFNLQSTSVSSTSLLLNSIQVFDIVSDSLTTISPDLVSNIYFETAIDILSTILLNLSSGSEFGTQIDSISSISLTDPEIGYAIDLQTDALTTITSAITTTGAQTLVLSGVQHESHIDLSWVPV